METSKRASEEQKTVPDTLYSPTEEVYAGLGAAEETVKLTRLGTFVKEWDMREQDLYRDMLKYRTGSDEEGNSRFAVPLEADEDGLLGRECPSEGCTPRYFKVGLSPEDEDDAISDDTIRVQRYSRVHLPANLKESDETTAVWKR